MESKLKLRKSFTSNRFKSTCMCRKERNDWKTWEPIGTITPWCLFIFFAMLALTTSGFLIAFLSPWYVGYWDGRRCFQYFPNDWWWCLRQTIISLTFNGGDWKIPARIRISSYSVILSLDKWHVRSSEKKSSHNTISKTKEVGQTFWISTAFPVLGRVRQKDDIARFYIKWFSREGFFFCKMSCMMKKILKLLAGRAKISLKPQHVFIFTSSLT